DYPFTDKKSFYISALLGIIFYPECICNTHANLGSLSSFPQEDKFFWTIEVGNCFYYFIHNFLFAICFDKPW
ncbi:MAG: hypothetical protein LIO97_04570, partial [Tannerellaceae bacterium]|nr:hypothetical protein [Tannerellaceae bacterium]